LLGEDIPDRHVGVDEAAPDGVVDIFIGGQGAGRSGAALESGDGEVSRLGIEPNGVLTIGISVVAVTTGAIAAVVVLRVGGMAGDIADVALHGLDHERTQRPYLGRLLGEGPSGEPGREDQPYNRRTKNRRTRDRGEKNRADTTHWLQAVHSRHPSTEVSAGETSSPADSSSSEIKVKSEQ